MKENNFYQYGYDDIGRLTSIDSPWVNDTITFQYDKIGQLKTLTPQSGQVINYNYDPLGRLTTIQSGTNTFTYGYTGVNPVIQSLIRPNGSVTEYLYNDPLKRLTEITNKTSAQAIINKHIFTYNNLDLIDTETITTGTSLDAFTAELKTYDYNNLNQLLSSTNPSQAFTYDDDGNMTQGYTPESYQFTATYDAENRLKTLEYTDSSSVVHKTEYFYSGDSQLAQVKKYENSILVNDTRFVKAGFLPVQERDVSNAITREYTWGFNMGGGIGGLLNLKQSGQDYSYLYDGKGNVSALIDSTQAVVASYRYDVFGKLLKKSGSLAQPYRFSTKLYDEQTGLIDFGYRFNNPAIGRWMTRDPLGEVGGINLYGFNNNSAVNFIDPFGLYTQEELANIIYNETASLSGEGIYDARVTVGHIAENRYISGRTDPGIASLRLSSQAKSALHNRVPSVVDAYSQAEQAATTALCSRDTTGGAKGFVIKGNPSKPDRYGIYPVLKQFGPFTNSYPTVGNQKVPVSQQLPATGVYINIFSQ